MATKKKKVKDLDPKGKSADIKGGRKDLLSKKQQTFVRDVVGKAKGVTKAIRD